MMTQMDPVVDAPPYRPFRSMVRIVLAAAVGIVVWIPFMLLASGWSFGPGESFAFTSRDDAEARAFSEHGPAWPVSKVRMTQTDDGFVVERSWFGLWEIRLPTADDLSTDTANYEYGPGETFQRIVATAVAVGCGVTVFVLLHRRRHL